MNLRSFLLFFILLISLSSFPQGFAQSGLLIDFQAPEQLTLDQETIVTLEITEGGDPVIVDDISITYIPADAVFDDVLYDCNDLQQMDNCRANNRGVAGIFEAVFDLKKLPLTVAVNADGVRDEIELTSVSSPVEEVAVEENSPVIPEVQAAVMSESVISPEQVQVGPSPAWWLIMAPLVLMCVVVSYFIVKTTD